MKILRNFITKKQDIIDSIECYIMLLSPVLVLILAAIILYQQFKINYLKLENNYIIEPIECNKKYEYGNEIYSVYS